MEVTGVMKESTGILDFLCDAKGVVEISGRNESEIKDVVEGD
jgi:hypothetical protein